MEFFDNLSKGGVCSRIYLDANEKIIYGYEWDIHKVTANLYIYINNCKYPYRCKFDGETLWNPEDEKLILDAYSKFGNK